MVPDWAAASSALTRGLSRLALRALAVGGAVGIVSFFLMRALPGDAAYRIAAGRYGYDMVNSATAEAVRYELGLDQPWWQQLAHWIGDLARGQLGVSLVSGESVTQELVHQLGHTVSLSLAAWSLALVVGLTLGFTAALARQHWLDNTLIALGLALKATPTFVLALMLALLLAEHAQWLPAAGHGEAAHFVLPSITLALGLTAGLAMVTLQTVRRVLQAPWVEFARSKGLAAGPVLRRHVLRNAATPIAAYSATQLVLLVEGVVVVESFFAWPGIGHALIHALISRDIPMVQGTALCMGWLFVVLNALVDAVCWLLDPRLHDRMPV